MDIQKKFQKFLKEDRTAINTKAYQPGDPQFGSVDDITFNAANVQDPVVLQRINGYLNSVASSPTINPYFVGKRIQDKLGIIGLHFDIPYFIGERGSEKKPVTQFGGMYGYENPLGNPYPHETGETKSVGFPDIGSNDGIKNRIPGGLDIKFTWTSVKGVYTLDVQLIPGSTLKSDLKEDENIDEEILGEDYITDHGYKPIHKGVMTRYKHPDGHTLTIRPSSKRLGSPEWWHKNAWGGEDEHGHGAKNLAKHLNGVHSIDESELDERRLKGLPRLKKGTPKASRQEVGQGAMNIRTIKEDDIDEVSPPGWSGTTKAMKKHKEISNPFALAWYLKKKGAHPHYKPEK